MEIGGVVSDEVSILNFVFGYGFGVLTMH